MVREASSKLEQRAEPRKVLRLGLKILDLASWHGTNSGRPLLYGRDMALAHLNAPQSTVEGPGFPVWNAAKYLIGTRLLLLGVLFTPACISTVQKFLRAEHIQDTSVSATIG